MMGFCSKGDDEEAVITEEDLKEQEEIAQEDEYRKGGYSPRLMQPSDLEIGAVIYDEEEDARKLALARKQVCTIGTVRVRNFKLYF